MHVQAVDSLLAELGVEYLVLPSVKLVLPMWRDKFGFTQLTPQEHEVGADTHTHTHTHKIIAFSKPLRLTLAGRNMASQHVCPCVCLCTCVCITAYACARARVCVSLIFRCFVSVRSLTWTLRPPCSSSGVWDNTTA